MSTAVPTLDQYDLKKIAVTPPKKNAGGKGQTSYVNTDQFPNLGKGILFEVKNAKIRFDLKAFREEGKPPSEDDKYNINLELDSENPDIVRLFKTIKALELRIAEIVAKNSEDWLFEEKDTSEVKGMMSSCIAKHRNNKTGEKYPDTCRVRVFVDKTTKAMAAKFRDGANNNELLDVNIHNSDQEIPRGTTGFWHIRVQKLWFSGGKMGLTMTLAQASVNRPEGIANLPEIGMASDSVVGRSRVVAEDDDDDTATTTTTTTTTTKNLVVTKDDIESDDDESDDAPDNLESDNEEPAPPKKKSVVKEGKKAAKPTRKTKAKA